MPHPLFQQAAFLGTDGKVYGTGPFHDLNAVPESVDIADEGFLTHDGRFLNRKQASDLVNSSKPIQSEQMFEQNLSQPEIDAIKEQAKQNRGK